jgi:hypothetical protein
MNAYNRDQNRTTLHHYSSQLYMGHCRIDRRRQAQSLKQKRTLEVILRAASLKLI